MRAVFCSKDGGNARATVPIAQRFLGMGVDVSYLLDLGGAAWNSYERDEGFRLQFQGMEVRGAESCDGVFPGVDFGFVSLSASGAPNLEVAICREAAERSVPLFGLEDVPGGRNNPGWGIKDSASPVRSLKILFTVMPTRFDKTSGVAVVIVGPPQLEPYRSLDVGAVGAGARRSLNIPEEMPIVYFSGQPDPASPHALRDLGEALWHARPGISAVTLVVSRHGRDKGIRDNGAAHRQVLHYVRERLGIRVIENSLDHQHLPPGDSEAIPEGFRPPAFVPYVPLVCACRNGVIVSGFGTDALIVAPHLGVLSILYLNPFLFGGLLEREKGMRTFSLPSVPVVSDVLRLSSEFSRIFDCESSAVRVDRQRDLARSYSFPLKHPAEIIAERVLQELASGMKA